MLARWGAWLLVLGLLLALAGSLPARADGPGPCPPAAANELRAVTTVLQTRPNLAAVAPSFLAGKDDDERMILAVAISWCLFRNEAVELVETNGRPVGSWQPSRKPPWLIAP